MTTIWFIFLIITLFTFPIKSDGQNKRYDEEQSHRSSCLFPDCCLAGNNKQVKEKFKSIGEVCPEKEGK